ncbi:hypothetical protein Nepgr_017560 [Nepenthes gracilis]|uniref:ABC transmembrane type-1 domain-containing protein n=1 Tax=Nepenthes gracilis TaxID=150966 RepID=A0AAD3XT80_NEPGR|nr:hypothetical protein Nepgr_017560 [Nepenthes gracilis]
MNSSAFIGSYLAAFLMLWRLTVVSFPFVVLLVIPGFLYGRISTGLATKLRDEYASLQGSVRLGLRQGLAKGLSIGSNGVVFAVWAFSSWYGSRLVMHHSGKGGTFFAVGASLTVGGL